MKDKGNRTIGLIKLLTAKETATMRALLSKHKRRALGILFHSIIDDLKTDQFSEIEKTTLFRKVFKKPYSKEKDYLLRNELRLLSKEVTGFLALEEARKELQKDDMKQHELFLRALLDRKAFAVFDKEWKKTLDLTLDQLDLETAQRIQTMMIDHRVQLGQATLPNYKDLIDQIAVHDQLNTRAFLHRKVYMDHKRAFAERTMQALGGQLEITANKQITIDPHAEIWGDHYTGYMLALTDSYRCSGEEKITLLKKASELASRISKKDFEANTARASISAGIALEYFLMKKFEESLPFHEQALDLGAKLPSNQVIAFVFNYLSTFIRLEDYQQAISLIEKYDAVWQKLPRMKDRFLCLKAMCHIFQGDAQTAEECIPEDRKHGGLDHYYYYRFIQIIVLFMKGKMELALNETDNFEHTVRYNDKNVDYLNLILAMKKLLVLYSEIEVIPSSELQKKVIRLKDSLTKASELAFADHALLYNLSST